MDFLLRIGWSEIVDEFLNVLREVVGGLQDGAAEGAGGGLVGAGSAAKSEVDTIGIERCESAELFRDDERGMIGEHDAAGADANCFCAACDVTNDDRCGGAGDSRHVV